MRRFSYWPFVYLFLFFICVFNAPKPLSERMRSCAVSSLSPSWNLLYHIKEKTLYVLTLPFAAASNKSAGPHASIEALQRENQMLQAELDQVREWLLSDDRIQEQYEKLKAFQNSMQLEGSSKEFFKRRAQELCQRLQLHMRSIPARIIFREPVSWSSALWIDVGEKHNQMLQEQIVCKNSPVLFGTSIIGVVEYVGQNRSRVRLITDARLTPSVRAIRGKEQDRFLLEQIDKVQFALKRRADLFSSEESEHLFSLFTQLAHKLNRQDRDAYLAKGEIFGSSAPLWRSRTEILKGVGFNCGFADEEGPSRDLRTGEPYGSHYKKESIALLRPGDLLITTGLDGVFPAGYHVATVSKVQILKEGASSYEIEAVATAGDLNAISHVVVLPAMQ